MLSRNMLLRAIIVVAALAASAGKLDAADLGSWFLDAPQTNIPAVQFGTGWYLRGDAAFADDSIPNLSPDLSQFLSNARQATVNLDLGFGYKFNSWLRADVTVDWWKPIVASGTGAEQLCVTQLNGTPPIAADTVYGTCAPRYNSSVQRFDGLANLYADVGTWYGITPYIGGGFGLSLTHISSAANWYQGNGQPYQISTDGFYFNYDSSQSITRYQFAWAAMAGFSYAITPNILLDVGYRYIDLGKLSSLPGPSGTATKTMDAHELRLGVRYMID
ncbi:MAG: outer membrane beta-barrel protein [Methylovirgula sp.]